MTPSSKDRQNSGISMAEKQLAEEHLTTALRAVSRYTASAPEQWEIRTAMAILGMSAPEEKP